MASGQGVATIDFGAFPGKNEATVVITGQSTISSTSKAEAYFMRETSSNHTANDHSYAAFFVALTCGPPTTGVGFTIYGVSSEKVQGAFTVRYVWTD